MGSPYVLLPIQALCHLTELSEDSLSLCVCRVGSAACVGTLTTTPSMTSPHAASLWSVTCWSLEIAGSCLRPARMPRCPRIPALPTLTASPGPKSSAASSTAQPSLPAMLMYGHGAGWALDLRMEKPSAKGMDVWGSGTHMHTSEWTMVWGLLTLNMD